MCRLSEVLDRPFWRRKWKFGDQFLTELVWTIREELGVNSDPVRL